MKIKIFILILLMLLIPVSLFAISKTATVRLVYRNEPWISMDTFESLSGDVYLAVEWNTSSGIRVAISGFTLRQEYRVKEAKGARLFELPKVVLCGGSGDKNINVMVSENW